MKISPESIVALYKKHAVKADPCHFNIENESCCALGIALHDAGFDGMTAQKSATYDYAADNLNLNREYVRGFINAFDCGLRGSFRPSPHNVDETEGYVDGRAVRAAVSEARLWRWADEAADDLNFLKEGGAL